MIVHYQAFANIGKLRLRGDLVKENQHTVWMIFHPPKAVRAKLAEKGILASAIGPIKRHKRKHGVSRFA
jgi:hypothetical protein